jgi:hypothetical protein
MEDVHILEGSNLLIDVDTPIINHLMVSKGRLIFADKDITFRVKKIVLMEGEFRIGTVSSPISSNLNIELHDQSDNSPTILC